MPNFKENLHCFWCLRLFLIISTTAIPLLVIQNTKIIDWIGLNFGTFKNKNKKIELQILKTKIKRAGKTGFQFHRKTAERATFLHRFLKQHLFYPSTCAAFTSHTACSPRLFVSALLFFFFEVFQLFCALLTEEYCNLAKRRTGIQNSPHMLAQVWRSAVSRDEEDHVAQI